MGRTGRKKKHTHVSPDESSGAGQKGVAKTFVMERGKVGRLLSQLVLDLRRIMEPNTASKLTVRQKNVLKDFVQVAGPLGVTHFVILSRTKHFINLKVCRLPHGPTLTFHLKAFCLSREVISSLKKPLSVPHQFLSPPLLVMNNFPSDDKPSKLVSTVFQNMFPSFSVQTVKLSDIKRCVLLNKNTESNTIELRHYAIRVQARGMSRSIKTLAASHVPDLSKYHDISEYVLGGQGSDSEGEELGGEDDIILPQDLPGHRTTRSQQSVVRLSELGPRLTLQLVKVEAGFCGGEVLHHAFIHKSKKEQRKLKKKVEDAKRLRIERRHQQEANVARKRRERELHRQQCLDGMAKMADSAEESGEDDDAEWYRQEVGEEPDPDTFVSTGSGGGTVRQAAGFKRRRKTAPSSSSPRSKRQKTVAGGGAAADGREQTTRGILKAGSRGGRREQQRTKRGERLHKPTVRFADKKKRTLKGGVGKGERRKRSGGQVFRRRAKAS